MNHFALYENISSQTARLITRGYSTSFSRSIIFLEPEIRKHIYHIYGFVRIADEIVDTFHHVDKKALLDRFVEDYKFAQSHGISTNPVLHVFVQTQAKYHIPNHLVEAFIESMYMDLGDMSQTSQAQFDTYIYGSAEVVGLMCLHVFLDGNTNKFQELKPYAQRFGAALQKVNFLRDIDADLSQLQRSYFPNVDFENFTPQDKRIIEQNIQEDFDIAIKGIVQLPPTSRFAVYLAYRYYKKLFKKIRSSDSRLLVKKRIRVNNLEKSWLFMKVYLYKRFQRLSHIQ